MLLLSYLPFNPTHIHLSSFDINNIHLYRHFQQLHIISLKKVYYASILGHLIGIFDSYK